MDYSMLNNFLKEEVCAGKQYKRIASPYKIFAIIATLPFLIFSIFLYVGFNVMIFFFELCSCGTRNLEQWASKMREGASPFAEGIIHLVTLPFIFFLNCILSLFSAMYFLNWFFLQCTLYIATLGGTKWRPYMTNVDTKDHIDGYKSITNVNAAQTSIIALAVFFIIYFIMYVVNVLEPSPELTRINGIFSYIYFLAAAIVIPVVFKKVRNDKALEDDEEAIDDEDDDDNFNFPQV